MNKVNLPEGWIKSAVGDYLYIKNGFAFKSNSYMPARNNTFPVIRISDIDGQEASDKNAVHVESGAEGFEVEQGDLLIAMSGATTGKIGVYQGKRLAYQNQRVGNVKLHSEKYGCNAYKNYLISALSKKILEVAYGGAQPNISSKAIEEIEIILPPLAEQKIIADKLDTLLAQVETTKARLERIPSILKTFRQSVLAAAVSGKLTKGWRRTNKLEQADWENTIFSEICRDITVGYVGKMADRYQPSGIPFLRSQNVRAFQYSETNLLYISEDFHKQIYKSRLESGDLAIVRSGAPGTTCVIPGNLGVANCSDLVIARPSEKLNSEFGCIFMNSEVAQKNVAENQVGVAQQHFNVGSMKKMPINLPSVSEQTEIVRRVEQFFAFADSIEQKTNNALERVNNLVQSILATAFRGELTVSWRAANPDLIIGENTAEALLAKIKAEREKNNLGNKNPGRKKAR